MTRFTTHDPIRPLTQYLFEQGLTLAQAEIIVLLMSGVPAREIAAARGSGLQTVHNLSYAGRKRMREAHINYCNSCASRNECESYNPAFLEIASVCDLFKVEQ